MQQVHGGKERVLTEDVRFLCPGDNSAPVGRERNHRGTPYTPNKRHRKIYRPATGHSERCRRATDGSRRLSGLNAGSFQRGDEETAHKWANTRKGAWPVAHSQILSTKLTNGILKKNGWCWLGMHRVNGMGR